MRRIVPKSAVSLAFCFALTLGITVIIAPPALAEGGSYTPIGRLVGGSPTDVAIAGGHAYVAAGGALVVADVSDAANPRMVAYCDTPGDASAVAVAGSYAYVADDYLGLRVISIANPLHPIEVGSCDIPEGAFHVAVSGNYAYVGDASQGLRVVNISNPASPVEVGSCNMPASATAVAVSGAYAYVAAAASGLRVIHVADPTNPHEEGFYDTPGTASAVALAGPYACIAEWGAGLRVIDVSNAAAPAEVGFCDTPGSATGVAVVGGYAFVADGSMGLSVIDISNPEAPFEAGSFHPPWGFFWRVAVSGNLACICDADNGLTVVDVTNPTAPAGRGGFDTASYPRGIAAAGGYAYVADDSNGLVVLDVSDPSAPQRVATGPVYLAGNRDVALASGYAYGLDSSSLAIWDLSNPEAPSNVGEVGGIYWGQALAVSGNYAYVADEQYGLRVVNCSNPAMPAIVGVYDTPGNALDVAVSGNYAYVADYDAGLRVINISDPGNPVEVGSCDTPGYAEGVDVSGGYAYVADDYAGLRIIDISNPAAPVEVGALPAYGGYYDGYLRAVAVSGNLAYVAAGWGGLWVVDVSDPAHPAKVAYYNTPGNAENVTVAGNYVYLADYDWGVMIFPKLTNVSVTGQVRVAGMATNIPNATVEAYSGAVLKGSTITDANGIYRLWDLPAGNYIVKAGKQGYVTQTKYPVSVGSGTTYVNFNLGISGRLTGQVKNKVSGANIAGAAVTASLGGVVRATGTTAANGIYLLDTNLPAGAYVVKASKAGYLTQTKASVSVTQDAATYVNFNLARVVLKGQTKAAATSAPLAGASVVVFDGDTPVALLMSTDASGIYEIAGLPTGTYRVEARKDTYVRQSKPNIAVSADSTTYVNFSLATSGILKGQVKDKVSGMPIIGATVVARMGGVILASAPTTAPYGIYEMNSDLLAGTYVVGASMTGYLGQTRKDIAVTAGVTTYVNFNLASGG